MLMPEFKDTTYEKNNSYRQIDYKDDIKKMVGHNGSISNDKQYINTDKVISTSFVKSENMEHFEFNVTDVPLPDIPVKDKNKKSRKRKNELDYHNSRLHSRDSKKHCSSSSTDKYGISKKRTESIKPKICLNRSVNRYGSTWGERSVNSFKILTEIGEGTYGHVFKALDRETQKIRALKKVRLEHEKEGFPITTVREIKILQKLKHQNIVEFLEVVTDYDIKNNKTSNRGFFLVFEYMDHDLYGIIDSGVIMSEIQIASIIKQILEGVNYCHKKMFLHRDLKCSNILMNSKGEVKLADFGLARLYDSDNKKRPYTNRVITLWYRAPELLLGEECYGRPIDIWSIGCIMGELFTHKTMFQASNEMDQLDMISKLCGTPNVNVWPDVDKLPLFKTYKPKVLYRRRLRDYYATLSIEALDVLDWMLQLDPKRRCSTEQVLSINWLKKVDPKKVKMIELPKDRDYHELSCKRRHRQKNPSETITYSSKQVFSESSTANSDDVGTTRGSATSTQSSNSKRDQPTCLQNNHMKHSKSTSALLDLSQKSSKNNFEVSDNLLDLIKQKLEGFPNSEQIIKQFDQFTDSNIEQKMQEILEPFIREIYASSSSTFTSSSSDNGTSTSHSAQFKSITSTSNNLSKSSTPPVKSKTIFPSSEKTLHKSATFTNFKLTSLETSDIVPHKVEPTFQSSNNHTNSSFSSQFQSIDKAPPILHPPQSLQNNRKSSSSTIHNTHQNINQIHFHNYHNNNNNSNL